MKINHLHFYVENAQRWKGWFVDRWGFRTLGGWQDATTDHEAVQSGAVCCLLSSPRRAASPVAQFLQSHPPGVVDVALEVADVAAVLERAVAANVKILQPLQTLTEATGGKVMWAQIGTWGTLHHTLIQRVIQRDGGTPIVPVFPPFALNSTTSSAQTTPYNTVGNEIALFEAIDHVVLNVEAGDLQEAVSWYEQVLGFQPRQSFTIQTDRSALQSQVLVCDQVQLPINAPCSSNSQIQEFLTHNRGPGIQHVALRTQDVIHTVAYLRERGIPFLTVPETYYQALQERHQAKTLELDWQALATQQILIDWPLDLPQSLLLQTFTQPIFAQPTFFFEVIERRTYHHQGQMHQAQGFGEGNFQALFEAIEREQEKRGSLKPRVNPAIKICNKTEMGLIDR